MSHGVLLHPYKFLHTQLDCFITLMALHSPVKHRFFFVCLFLVDLEWKIIYVGSAESEEYDQVLDSVLVGPVPAGRHMFVFQVCLVGTDCSLCRFRVRITLHSESINSIVT